MTNLSGKELVLGVLTVAAGLLNAYLWKGVVFAGEFKNAAFYSLPVIALLAFAILFALSATFIRRRILRSSAAILALASNYILIPYSPLALGAAAITALGGWYGAEQISNEYAASNYFSVRKILKSGLPVFFTSVALVLSVFYFSTISDQDSSVLLPRSLFDVLIPIMEGPLQSVLPGFRSQASVDDLILTFVAKQAGAEIDISRLSRAERSFLLAQGRKAVTEQLGLKLIGNEKGSDVLYQAANAQIAKLAGPYQKYIPFVAAFGFFLAVKTFTLPVYWLTLILVAGVVKLLVMLKVLKQETETIQITKIRLI